MTSRGTDEYLEELARAEPSVTQTLHDRQPPPPPLPDYANRYVRAFNALRHDRPYATVFRVLGSPHGVPIVISEIQDMPIALATLEHYADRHGIVGAVRSRFVRLLAAMDDEYRAVLAEQRAGNTQIEEETD